MAIEKPMRIPVNGTWEEFNPRTTLNMISDMSAFMRLLNVAADATAARKTLDAAATNHGIHVPAGGTNTQFLRGDLTWQSIQTVIGQGFVAQSLQQNGWVKAANGLIIQWGTFFGNSKHVTGYALPIAYVSWFVPLACDGGSGTLIPSISADSLWSVEIYSNGASWGFHFITIGY